MMIPIAKPSVAEGSISTDLPLGMIARFPIVSSLRAVLGCLALTHALLPAQDLPHHQKSAVTTALPQGSVTNSRVSKIKWRSVKAATKKV